jgi:hypothetical protein
MIDRLVRWLREPVLPPRWIAHDRDPFDDIDWSTFGRTVGGRIRVLDNPPSDPGAAARWETAGRRKLGPAPRWRWIGLAAILFAEAVLIIDGLTLLASRGL